MYCGTERASTIYNSCKLCHLFVFVLLQCLLIVRHGESEYNRACTESKSYADPHIFDPQLTAKGHHQVCFVCVCVRLFCLLAFVVYYLMNRLINFSYKSAR